MNNNSNPLSPQELAKQEADRIGSWDLHKIFREVNAHAADREELLRERYQTLEDERACLKMTIKDAKANIALCTAAFAECMERDSSRDPNKLRDLEIAWQALEEARAGAKTLIGAARESVRHARKELDEAMRASKELAETKP